MKTQYREYSRGTIDFLPSRWTTVFNEGSFRDPPLNNIWEEVKPMMDAEFV